MLPKSFKKDLLFKPSSFVVTVIIRDRPAKQRAVEYYKGGMILESFQMLSKRFEFDFDIKFWDYNKLPKQSQPYGVRHSPFCDGKLINYTSFC